MDRMRDDMSRMWNRMRSDWNLDHTRPRTHLHQMDDGYLAEFEVPGVDPDLVEIEVDDESVSVRGEFPACPGETDDRVGESFHVVMSWPTEVDPETAEANFRHGLLSVTAHKTASRRRRISLQSPH